MSTRIVFVTLLSAALLSSCTSPSETGPTQAQATVSAHVGALLKEAQTLAGARNWKGAAAKVNEADGQANKTATDTQVISQMRNFIAAASGDTSTPAGAKAKFANDYNAGRYRDVIAGAETLEKYNAFGAQEQLLVGQAYYKAGDYVGCVKYAKTLNSDNGRELEARCAYEVAKAPQP